MRCWNLDEYRYVSDTNLTKLLQKHDLKDTKIFSFIALYIAIKKYVTKKRKTIVIKNSMIVNKNDTVLNKLKIKRIHQNLLAQTVHLYFLSQYPVYNFEEARIVIKTLKQKC